MSTTQHIEWLNLVETTGPFLAVGVLDEAFPQGLDKVETQRRQRVRSAYDEWRDAVDSNDPLINSLHREWVRLIFEELLDYDSSVLKPKSLLPASINYYEPLSGVEVRPDFAALAGVTPRLLIAHYAPDTDLTAPLRGDDWITASPIERMTQLCRAVGVRLGLVTNGERWSVVSLPSEGGSSVATWFARIWQQEPVTLQAFVSLLGVRRCFGKAEDTFDSLVQRSQGYQSEVTDTLGEQVRRAVEVLVQALDKADAGSNRQLLTGAAPAQLYEAGVTVMMRLVVLLCAEQRGLLLLGVDTYDQHYAITTLRARLVKEQKDLTDEVQERRHDAWSRILAVCRGVFGGIEHVTLRLPPLGGSLFDPDRFPFLEGRAAGTVWRETPATPLPIDNRTVLTLLTALQVLEQSAGAQLLSYEALDVEQVGHVYEGLLERTVRRVPEVTLGLVGSAKAYNPNVSLRELEGKAGEGRKLLLAFLEDLTGRSTSALCKILEKPADEAVLHRLAVACGTKTDLLPRLMPFAGLVREDTAKRLLVYDEGSLVVTLGDSRRATGTHYTPKSLTEPIVQHTLEPLVYAGPREGKPRHEWRLQPPAELLALKICDMAMGSAAFLVQACRWLADRLVEAWDIVEKNGQSVSMEGAVLGRPGIVELLPRDKAERVLIARRLVASRCLYGVDKNPMAVDLAKVSLWLVTMMKGRPFSFLDHTLKCGDSLLGVSSLKQIEDFSLRVGDRQVTFATANLFRYVKDAEKKRRELEVLPSNDYSQIEAKNRLHVEAEAAIANVRALADALIAFELRGLEGDAYEEQRAEEAAKVHLLIRDIDASLDAQRPHLLSYANKHLGGHRTFHWPVEFPEVFEDGGFNAFVGNPPFLWALRISIRISIPFSHFLKRNWPHARKNADLCAYFLIHAVSLTKCNGTVGLVLTNTISEADTRETALDFLVDRGNTIYRAASNQLWPGTASVRISPIHLVHGSWNGPCYLDEVEVKHISTSLEAAKSSAPPSALSANLRQCFKGSVPLGDGFFLEAGEVENLKASDPKYSRVLFPYLTGEELNFSPTLSPGRWVIYFRDWSLESCEKFPLCLELLRRRVKPERDKIVPTNGMARQRRELWWKFTGPTVDLYDAIEGTKQVLVASAVSKHHAFAFVPSSYIYSNALNVFAYDSFGYFALLQSSLHAAWALKHGSKLEDRPRYNVTDCFETFPHPISLGDLAKIGAAYHDFRADLISAREEGLTSTYNRFHDRGEMTTDIVRLRKLHVELDQTVAAAYGWDDLDLSHGFQATKQGARYTISENARHTVLDRLLALNHQRYEEEGKVGFRGEKGRKRRPTFSRADKAAALSEKTRGELL